MGQENLGKGDDANVIHSQLRLQIDRTACPHHAKPAPICFPDFPGCVARSFPGRAFGEWCRGATFRVPLHLV